MQIYQRRAILAGLAGVGVAGVATWPLTAAEPPALVAVATNFAKVAATLKPVFEAESGYEITLTSGSTGKLYAQIINGAPYAALLAADQARPQLLEAAGLGHGRVTYARGLLTLWQPQGTLTADSLRENSGYLAIANPTLAPYGLAAKQALQALGLWQALQPRIVTGQNVGQAFALVASGNADMGLVAQSYALGRGASWPVPPALYAPILQDAILLGDHPAAAAFVDFMLSETGRQIIRNAGYGEVAP